MGRFGLLFGLIVIVAVIISGCAGKESGIIEDKGKKAAFEEYNAKIAAFNNAMNALPGNPQPGGNATRAEVQAWLDGYRNNISLCEKIYNETVSTGRIYASYLDNSSEEYRNITDTEASLGQELQAQKDNYAILEKCYIASEEKEAALSEYSDACNATVSVFNDLYDYIRSSKPANMDEYKAFISGLDRKINDYDACCNDAISAGRKYQQYLDPGSAEYNQVSGNEQAFQSNLKQFRDVYNGYRSNYESKKTQLNDYNDYAAKLNKVNASANDIERYRASSNMFSRLNKTWIDGYGQKVNAFSSSCDDAIAAGKKCQQYLDPESAEYKSIAKNEKDMNDAKARYRGEYNEIESRYKNLHKLDSMFK